MPTGYTAEIKDGISFEKFTLNCARAFGALIEMRDDPADAPIPDKFEPSDYHVEQLAKAETQLKELEEMSDETLQAKCDEDYKSKYESWKKYEQEKLALKKKYLDMLARVREWQVPSKDHEGLKDFMVDQLNKSIDFDCYISEAPEKLSAQEWKDAETKSRKWAVNYHATNMKEEIKRSEGRTEWVQQLKQSLTPNQSK
jgi:hypothetical protein